MKEDIYIHQPHDSLFQAALTHKKVAIDLLKNRLPAAIKKRLDFNTLTLERTSFIDKRLKRRYSDVVYSANIDEEKGYIYTLIEHQSTEDDLQILRLLEYMIKLIVQHMKKHPKCKRYPAIIPLVCYVGDETYKGPKSIAGAFEDPELFIQTLRNNFLTELNKEEDEETLKDKSAALLGMLLKYARFRDFCQLFESKTFIRLLRTSPYQIEALFYIVSQDQHEPEHVLEKIAILGQDKKNKIMSYLQQALKRNRQEGRQEERIEVAKKLLQKSVDVDIIQQVTGLSLDEIRNLPKK